MGYELEKLKKQYGVSSPTRGSYAGPAAPVVPTMPETLAKDATKEQKEAYNTAKTAYDAYVKDPSAFNDLMRKYELGQREYNQYRDEFTNRMMNTPMYGAEYDIGLKNATKPVTYEKPLQMPTYGSFNAAMLSKPEEDLANYYTRMRDIGYTDKDIYDTASKSGGRSGVYNLSMALDKYGIDSGIPKLNWDPRFGTIPSSTEMTVIPQGAGYEAYWLQPHARGGAVRKFAKGGDEGVPEDDITSILRERSAMMGGTPPPAADERFPDRAPMPVAPMQQSRVMEGAPQETQFIDVPSRGIKPIAAPAPSTTPISPAATDLMAILSRYDDRESAYGKELAAARKRATAETSAFTDMIAKAMQGDTEKPSKAEMYFRLAAAFGSPTKTGAFGENLALAGKEMAEYAKDVRVANKADKQLRLQLALEAQKIKAQGAREELASLRALAGEEMKDKRAMLIEYIKSGRPQSEAGKAAIDAGLKQGTPEFTSFVNNYIDDKIRSGNLLKEAMVAIAAGNLNVAQKGLDIKTSAEKRATEAAGKLTPAEVKLKSEAEATLGGLDDSIASLKRAYALNPNTFDGTLAATAQRKILEQTDPKDPRVLATREQSNLLSKGAIDKLRASFGGNPTEGERAALLSLEGIDSKSKEERAIIMKNTFKLLQARRAREAARLEEIKRGAYRETTPATGELE
jgi:hypothetical protein